MDKVGKCSEVNRCPWTGEQHLQSVTNLSWVKLTCTRRDYRSMGMQRSEPPIHLSVDLRPETTLRRMVHSLKFSRTRMLKMIVLAPATCFFCKLNQSVALVKHA